MTRLVHRFLHDDSGATSIEYAAIASLLSIAIVTAALGLGSKLKDTYTGVSTALTSASTRRAGRSCLIPARPHRRTRPPG